MIGNIPMAPMYDPNAVQPMRNELTYVGFSELTTADAVDAHFANHPTGTTLVMINSVCGCAAGSARPGVAEALQHTVIPDHLVTVFAGQDRDATARVREKIVGFPPSSPSAALFKDGKVVFMMERWMIEGRHPKQIADMLTNAFNQHCSKTGPSISKADFDKLVYFKSCGSKIPKNPALQD